MYMKKVPSKHTSSSNRHKTQPSRNHIGIKRNFYRYRHIPLVMLRRFHIRREHSEFWVMTYLLYSWEKRQAVFITSFCTIHDTSLQIYLVSYYCCKYDCWFRKNYIEQYKNSFKLLRPFKETLFRTLRPWDQSSFESMYP